MNWEEFNSAVRTAKQDINYGDDAARSLGKLMANRLRVAQLDRWTLDALKRELRDWDMVTHSWKDKP